MAKHPTFTDEQIARYDALLATLPAGAKRKGKKGAYTSHNERLCDPLRGVR